MTFLRSLFIAALISSFAFASIATAAVQADNGAIAADKKADAPKDGKKEEEEPECD